MASEAVVCSVLPPFADAVGTFGALLRQQGAPAKIVWVSREEVTTRRRRVWVRLHNQTGAASLAEAIYAKGKEEGLGVSLRALCRVGNQTAAYVWVPRDAVDASYAMQPSSLRCYVPTPMPAATPVTSTVAWWMIATMNRWHRYGNIATSEMPSRKQIDLPPSVIPEG